ARTERMNGGFTAIFTKGPQTRVDRTEIKRLRNNSGYRNGEGISVTDQPVFRGLGCWILRSEVELQKGGTAYEEITRGMRKKFGGNASGLSVSEQPTRF
ncbi:MAG: hypothetical protein WBE63_02150, partial [Acidobacteriaceae bacterium]